MLAFVCVYGALCGRGFIADDFEWADSNRLGGPRDLVGVFLSDNGFYRPLVGVTFAANEFFAGTNPKWYGLTNVALAVLCALSIYLAATSLNLPRAAAMVAPAVWLLNVHGVNMAVLWLSGRTALLLTLFATLCLAALARGHVIVATSFLAAALLSKEEAVLLPVIGVIWLIAMAGDAGPQRAKIIAWSAWSLITLGAYFWLRSLTNAMLPSDAPWFYQFNFGVGAVARNVLEYADRSSTVATSAVIVAALALGQRPWRHVPTMCVFGCGAAVLLGGFGITVFLPVRSSLYACFPSVGVALISGAFIARMWTAATPKRQVYALVAMMVVTLGILVPVHLARAQRWVTIAEFSRQASADLERLTTGVPEGAKILLRDDRTRRGNAASAFGSLLGTAVRFKTGRSFEFWIDPPPMGGRDSALLCAYCFDFVLAVKNGRIVPSAE